MANIFQRSWDDLGQLLRTADGRLLQAGEPAPTPYVPGYVSPSNPPGYISPTNQAAAAAQPTQPQSPPGYISPTNQAAMGTPPASRGTSGSWDYTSPPPPPASRGTTGSWDAAQPTQPTQPTQSPPGYISPTNQAAMNAANPPTKVTTKIDRPTHSETHSIQAKPPKPIDNQGTLGDESLANQAINSGGGRAPVGPAPATGSPPAAPAAQGQDFQLPAQPGFLQRLGQTISHFLGGTLGQHPTVGQYAAGAPQPGAGQTESLGQLPAGSALSGISHALASGRQHVATHGGSAPASAPAPDMRWAAAYNQDWTPTPLGSPDITRPLITGQSLAYGPYGRTPLGSPDIVRPIKK